MALGGLIAALKIVGGSLADQRFLFLGAGTAGVGIADLLVQAMAMDGVPTEEARKRCWLFDVKGLIQSGRDGLAGFQKPFAHEHAAIDDFAAAVEDLKPTTIIGVSTAAKAFSQRVIEAMARINERPIIFPYSNPTSRSECTAEEAYKWSDGRAVFASGSPFGPVHLGDQTFIPGQGNNVYIFPAMGMAIYATEARRVTDAMFIVAAKALSDQVTDANLKVGLIYPPQRDILNVSLKVAAVIAAYIFDEGLAGVPKPDNVETYVSGKAYSPEYPQLD